MPRYRLALRAYASFHGQILIGPYADPNQVEADGPSRKELSGISGLLIAQVARP
jgi:hypothetical protein